MFKHEELVRIAGAWLLRHGCSVSLLEPAARFGESPDAIGWAQGNTSILVECKTSRADFHNDAKKPHRKHPKLGAGILRYYLVPKGLLKPEEVPDDWGLLYAYPKMVKIIKRAPGNHRKTIDVVHRELAYLTSHIWKIHSFSKPQPAAGATCATLDMWLAGLRIAYWQLRYDLERARLPKTLRALELALDNIYFQVELVNPELLRDLVFRLAPKVDL